MLSDAGEAAALKAEAQAAPIDLKGGLMPSPRIVPVICHGCDVEFVTSSYEIKRGNGKFCSRQCQRAHQARCNAAAMKGTLSQTEMNRRSRANTPPEVIAAHHAVEHEIKMGRMVRGRCEVCGADRVDGHHDDYAKPLEVRWLCRGHHLQLHRARS